MVEKELVEIPKEVWQDIKRFVKDRRFDIWAGFEDFYTLVDVLDYINESEKKKVCPICCREYFGDSDICSSCMNDETFYKEQLED